MPIKHRQWRFHGLKKPKIRQDWNKYNLYNLSRLKQPSVVTRTFFQQKWTAKAMTRAYHGEQIMEKKWVRMFDRRTPAVVPMNPKALAADDGTQYSAGRGSGKEPPPLERRSAKSPNPTPYMQMVYHPTERRLDTAIFRALFASSARQARQFVTHGHVKVNGKKMIYPGYMLNPGDMFQVDPSSVLTCTGKLIKPKTAKESGVDTKLSKTQPAAEVAPAAEEVVEDDPGDQLSEEEARVAEDDPAASIKKALLSLRNQAVELEEHPPKGQKLSGKQKQDLRAFRKILKSSISRPASVSPSTLDDLESEWLAMSTRIKEQPDAATTTSAGAAKVDSPPQSTVSKAEATAGVSETEEVWQPKLYMSAFAFVPRYLEVNQSICSAVYLRHPVCKPGFAEVPTPFHPETGQLTFNWYLRRR